VGSFQYFHWYPLVSGGLALRKFLVPRVHGYKLAMPVTASAVPPLAIKSVRSWGMAYKKLSSNERDCGGMSRFTNLKTVGDNG